MQVCCATDCRFFLAGRCDKGERCGFRHCAEALLTVQVCPQWRQGLCANSRCPLRHPPLPATSASASAGTGTATSRSNTTPHVRHAVPQPQVNGCWFYAHGQCTKGEHCTFSHDREAINELLRQESQKQSQQIRGKSESRALYSVRVTGATVAEVQHSCEILELKPVKFTSSAKGEVFAIYGDVPTANSAVCLLENPSGNVRACMVGSELTNEEAAVSVTKAVLTRRVQQLQADTIKQLADKYEHASVALLKGNNNPAKLKLFELEALKRYNDERATNEQDRMLGEESFNVMIKRMLQCVETATTLARLRNLHLLALRECKRLLERLPFYLKRGEIVVELKRQFLVVVGQTGSGKSTQMAQYVADELLLQGATGRIVCIQPRRIAAHALCRRLKEDYYFGDAVQYGLNSAAEVDPADEEETEHTASANDSSSATNSPKIHFVTDRSFLDNVLQSRDETLSAFNTVIVDEVHERNVLSELVLALVKRAATRNTKLRVIVTSATIDEEVFLQYLPGSKLVNVPGRAYPIEYEYRPITDDGMVEVVNADKVISSAINVATQIIKEQRKGKRPAGDILVFLTGPNEVEKAVSWAQNGELSEANGVYCMPLHGQLTLQEQKEVLLPPKPRGVKVVFSTNVAETSVTINGVSYVVDSGLSKEARYDARRNLTSVTTGPICASSAKQRAGRAGRTKPGTCVRLYSQEQFEVMDANKVPEICTLHLGLVVLKLKEAGVVDVLQFDFVSKPDPYALEQAEKSLRMLGAVGNDGQLTQEGRLMLLLPTPPEVSRMLLVGARAGIASQCASLATLSGTSIFFTSVAKREDSNYQKSIVGDEQGDLLMSLKVFSEWEKACTIGGRVQTSTCSWCRERNISAKAMARVHHERGELLRILTKFGFRTENGIAQADQLQRAIFSGFFPNLCMFSGNPDLGYLLALQNVTAKVHPGSVLSLLGSKPKWLVYTQLSKTTAVFISGLTAVDPSWLTEASLVLPAAAKLFDLRLLQDQQLLPVVFYGVSRRRWMVLCGKRGRTVAALQDSWRCSFMFEDDKQQLTVWATSKEALEAVRKHCTDVLSEQNEMERNAQLVVPLTEKSLNRVVLQSGFQPTYILDADSFIEVFIKDLPVACADDPHFCAIKDALRKYGAVTSVEVEKDDESRTARAWVQFSSPQAAAQCCSDAVLVAGKEVQVSKHVAMLSSSAVSHTAASCASTGHVEIFCWLATCSGRGELFFESEGKRDSAFQLLSVMNLLVDRTPLTLRKNKNPCAIFVNSLPSTADKWALERTVQTALGEKPKSVVVFDVPQQPDEQPPEQEDLACAQLLSLLHQYTTLDVNVFPPDEKNKRVKVHVVVNSIETAKAIVAGLNGTPCPFRQSSLLRCAVDTSVMIRVFEKQYHVLAARVEATVARVRRVGAQVTVLPPKEGFLKIRVEAVTNSILRDAVRAIELSLLGEQYLPCAELQARVPVLFSAAGSHFLVELQARNESTVYLHWNQARRFLKLYGTREYVASVREEITKWLRTVRPHVKKSFSLVPGAARELLLTYGKKLAALEAESHAQITLRHISQKVFAEGFEDGVEVVHNAVEKCNAKAEAKWKQPDGGDGTAATGLEAGGNECSFCLNAIEPNVRTLSCGHRAWCNECLHKFIMQFSPATCTICGAPISVPDVQSVLPKEDLDLLARKACSTLVLQHSDTLRFCPSLDCGDVIAVGKAEGAVLCTSCSQAYCRRCAAKWVEGHCCQDILPNLYQLFLAGIRPCPHCKALVQKDGGCNKVHCTSCDFCFCWVCAQFSDKDQNVVYTHLTQQHSGFFGTELLPPPKEAQAVDHVVPELDDQILEHLNMKRCPVCSVPVEKNHGCNAMHCLCNTYWCWHCGTACASEEEVNQHVVSTHGALFAEEDVVY
eukprot:TRINITY_DN3867_c0_g1_i6.p1 TRINITY_DN3867_c0_g1~~TRINITY_DN3867_c0_g1_i6.p1  ORF type:complete len:1901 (+),score=452.51 TRINITY_DN3867_c0_g1_i6:40-5703(+)